MWHEIGIDPHYYRNEGTEYGIKCREYFVILIKFKAFLSDLIYHF